MNEKFVELMKNEAFAKELLEQETIEDAQKFLESHGIKMSEKEIEEIRKGVINHLDNNEELSEDQLENVAGGSGSDIASIIEGVANGIVKIGDAVDNWTRRRW